MKSIVITGASSGLGQEIALLLQTEKLFLLSRNKPCKKLQNHTWISCDITSYKDIQNASKKIPNPIDIFIHCSGIGIAKPFENTSIDEINTIIQTNVFGAIYLTQEIYKKMITQQSGHIIMITSTSAKKPRDGETIYCASKFAQAGFSESLHLEGIKHNIKITTVYPGGMKTNFYRNNPTKNIEAYMDPKFVAMQIISLITSEKNSNMPQLIIERPH